MPRFSRLLFEAEVFKVCLFLALAKDNKLDYASRRGLVSAMGIENTMQMERTIFDPSNLALLRYSER